MLKHLQRRYFCFGCTITLLFVAALMVGLFLNTNQIPTVSFVSINALLVLQGPLKPCDEGFRDLWEHMLLSLRREDEWLEKVLRWLGMPLEMTVAFYQSKPSPNGIVALNFPKGYRLLWIPFRVFGRHYKGAHYFASTPRTVLGMYGGTLILANDEATFCLAIDNLSRSRGQQKFHLSPPHCLRDRYDFVGVMNPRFLLPQDYGQLPSNMAEVGIDIIGANKLKGEVFWICQSEREAEAVMKALDRVEEEVAREAGSRGGRCSFRKWRESMFVWWEFRFTGFAFLP